MNETADYEYDVFVSYRRHPPISDWVSGYFYDELVQWLASALPLPPRIFIDESIETGDDFPSRLRRTLLRSCFLVVVWSPNYFRSAWCVAELSTMIARERLLAMRTDNNPRGLVFPVKFQKGEYLPQYVRAIEFRDYSDWAITAPYFRDSPKYLDFQVDIKDFAELIAQRLAEAPPWQPDWPIETPAVNGAPDVMLPRL
jgi:TIR domain